MSLRRIAALLCFVLINATACSNSNSTVDGSSAENAKASLLEIRDDYTDTQNNELDDALQTIALNATGETLQLNKLAQIPSVRSAINGKTGNQIIADARRITRARQHEMNQELELLKAKKGRKTANRRRVLREIEKLQTKLDAENLDVLSKFEVQGAWFGLRRGKAGTVKTIEVAVRNETNESISRVRFRILLVTPGREAAWIESEFTHSIKKGQLPGQDDTWTLQLPRASDWAEPIDHEHMLIVAQPIALNGLGGKPLVGARFDVKDRRRLRSLLDTVDFEGKDEVEAELRARNRLANSWRHRASAASAKFERDFLQKKYDRDHGARASLNRLVVTGPRLYFSKKSLHSDPIIELTIHNETGDALSRFRALGTLKSGDRKTPWVESTFNYGFKKPLLPGQHRTLKLAPRTFSPWGQAPKRNDLTLDVTMTRLESAEGQNLYLTHCSESEWRRLRWLKAMVIEFSW